MKLERLTTAVVSLCIAVACRSTEMLSPLTPAQLCARRDSIGRAIGGAFPTLDDDFEIMARLLPGGFGGLAANAVFLKQPELADTARGTARTLASCPGETLGNLWRTVQFGEVRRAQFDWFELLHWNTVLLSVGIAGMCTAAIDGSNNRLAYTFGTAAALEAFRSRAAALGVPGAVFVLSQDLSGRAC
jgi:hypothetical protein